MYFIIFLLATTSLASQYVPIPAKPEGYILGNPSTLIIEAYYDLICPDSKVQFFVFEDVLKEIGQTKFQYNIHMQPLPYHKAAFPAGQGFRFLRDNVGGQAPYEFARAIFEVQETLNDPATFDKTWQQVLDMIQSIAEDKVYPKFNFDKAKFAAALKPGTRENLQVRYEWKYGAHRGVSGAPIFMVNSVLLDEGEENTKEQWIELINKMNPQTKQVEYLQRFNK